MLQAFTGLGSAAKPPTPETARELTRMVASYWEKQAALWTRSLAAGTGAGKDLQPVVDAERGDRRFHGEQWRANPWYSLLKQTYLLNSQLLDEHGREPPSWTTREKHKLRFFARQFIDSMSPANFAATNPDVDLRPRSSRRAKAMQAGFANLLEDMRRGRISITDETAFEVGTQRGGLRRLGGLRERAVPVDPVRAADRQGRDAAAADRAAVHQQVLHPRPAARELVRALCLRTGHDGVPGLLAQSRREPGPRRPGTTTSRRAR